ncbi:predicted protein [Botrytis cinerea T4]|uniref:Uncharacterized protein n=1 Tax=Botryotinia fuckeliana (strain T4) TaxID=999810 RepID=G2YWF9_BOTF4|nr:predicted protein [Botrytis cinerea T4]
MSLLISSFERSEVAGPDDPDFQGERGLCRREGPARGQ